jgi:O-antigen/teichoic acid export membrane protein
MRSIGITQAFQFYQVSRYAALVLTGVILAKTGFSTTEIGVFETLILISGVTSFFWLNGLLNTYIVRSQQDQTPPTREVLVLIGGITLIICLALMVLNNWVISFFSLSENMLYWMIPFIVLSNLSFLTEHILLVRERPGSLLWLGLAHLIMLPLLVLIAALSGGNIALVIGAMCVFLFLKNIFLVILLQSELKHKSKLLAGTLLTGALPLIGSYFFGGISIYADGMMVNYFFDKSEFAVYQYGAREFPLSLLMANAFGLVMVRYLSSTRSEGLERTKAGSLQLWHQLFPIAIVLMFITPYIFPIVFNEQFSNSYIYFNIYLLLLIPRLIFPQSILIAEQRTQIQLYISMAEFSINIIASLVLMQFLGLAGIAFGTLIAYAFEKITMVVYLHRKNIPIQSYVHLNWYLAYSIALISVFIMSTGRYL